MKKLSLLGAAAASLLLACSGKMLDVGSDHDTPAGGGASSSGGGGVMGGTASHIGGSPSPSACTEPLAQDPAWPNAAECLPAPDSPLVGTWRGHWPDPLQNGSADAVLTIAGLTENGTPCGSFRVGEGADPPPATDGAAYYPPGTASGSAGGPAYDRTLFQGHEYPLADVESTPTRLAFGVPTTHLYRGWCQLQVEDGDSGTCVDLPGGVDVDGGSCSRKDGQAVSCARVTLCGFNGLCRCDGACCDAATGGRMQLDLHWDDGSLEGTVDEQQIYLDPVPQP